MNTTKLTTAERINFEQGLAEVRASHARETAAYRNSPQGQPGYVPTWAPRPSFQSIASYLANKPADQITREEAEEAVADLQANPHVESVAISQFHPVQKRWLFNVELVDGINGDLTGEHSIGRIYGDLRGTEAEWQDYLAEKKAEEDARRQAREEYLQSLDDAAAEAIALLKKNGFTVDDVIDCINRMAAGRYVDPDWRMTRAFEFHSDVICPKYAHLNDHDRPVQMRVGFYYGARRYRD